MTAARLLFAAGALLASASAFAGFASGGTCYATAVEAAQAECISGYPYSITRADGVVVRYSCEAAADGVTLYVEAADPISGAASSAQYSRARVFASCDEGAMVAFVGEAFLLALGALAVVWAAHAFVLKLVTPL